MDRNYIQFDNILRLPLLSLRGLAVIPGTTMHFDVGRKSSINAVEAAMKNNQEIFLVAQRDMKTDDPKIEDLYLVGTISVVKQILKLPGDILRVLVEGKRRAKLVGMIKNRSFSQAELEIVEEKKCDPSSEQALLRQTKTTFENYADTVARISPDIIMTVLSCENISVLVDYIASNINLELHDKQHLLEEYSNEKRALNLIEILENEIEVISIEQEIHEKVRASIDKNQREYYLREQIKAIQGELGDAENSLAEAEIYKDKIRALKLDKETSEKLYKEADRLAKTSFGSAEGGVIRTYLDYCLELPWNKRTKEVRDIAKAKKILDRDHFGLDDVKNRILEYLAVRQLSPNLNAQILCLVGPPGVGKTSVAKSIAKAAGRNYARVSLGGVRDEADIRGHRKTYVASMPGRIITALIQAKSKNSLLLFDEIDKMSNDFRGDPASAMLEVLDSEQNKAFRDHYIELPFDLSETMFITTANTIDTIPRPLLDRMEVIELSSYTDEEKVQIAKKHLIPKQMKKHGLTVKQISFTDDGIRAVIDGYTRESGVRNLERELASVMRKCARTIVEGKKAKVTVLPSNIEDILGPIKFKPEKVELFDEIGVANGLAWTSVGGEMLKIEVSALEGTGKIELTGSLGDVMKESARAAISYVRSRSEQLGIDKDFYKTKDIHIHVPEGATPKDGPSAGITITCALISELAKVPVYRDVAMTGEITLRGKILAIGGLKEKTMAAKRYGIKTVVIPEDNRSDLLKIDPTVREKLKFVMVSNIDGAIETIIDFSKVKKPETVIESFIKLHEEPKKNIIKQ